MSKRKSTLQKFSKEVFIRNVSIADYADIDGHVSYIIEIKGRTKYLVSLQDLTKAGLIDDQNEFNTDDLNDDSTSKYHIVEYCIVKRYSELLTFHKILQQEMKNYMKKKGYNPEDFPDFPPKKLFNKSKSFIERRIN
jgi:hypothetical protein